MCTRNRRGAGEDQQRFLAERAGHPAFKHDFRFARFIERARQPPVSSTILMRASDKALTSSASNGAGLFKWTSPLVWRRDVVWPIPHGALAPFALRFPVALLNERPARAAPAMEPARTGQ